MPMDLEPHDSPKPDEVKAPPAAVVEEVRPITAEEQCPSKILTGVLNALKSKEEVADFLVGR